MTKYSFDWPDEMEDAVECPELTAFLADLDEVLRKHGVGFKLERSCGDDAGAEFLLVPYEKHDKDVLTDDLQHYTGGIPWLDSAKAAALKKRDDRYELARQESHQKGVQARQLKERELLANGVLVGGKHYRLVEE